MDEITTRRLAPSPAEPLPAEFDLLCEKCGYSLVGLVNSKRCPECGSTFDPFELPLARVPWLYRGHRGWWSSYWETVWLIERDPAAFARDICRPVRISAPDAKHFRNVTGWIAAGTSFGVAMMGAVGLVIMGTNSGLAAICMAFGLLIGIRCFVLFATDMPTFIWAGPNRSNPHELSPLQHYASGIVSLAAVPVAFIGILLVLNEFNRVPPILAAVLVGAAVLTGGYLAIDFLRISVTFMRVATHCSRGRQIVLGLYLPLHWLLLAIISGVITLLVTVLARLVVIGLS